MSKSFLFHENASILSKAVKTAGAQAEPAAEELYSIPNEAGCSAEFPQGCIFGE